MFLRHDITLMSNPVCSKEVDEITASDFNYYDKDGFELNQAEQKYYSAMNYPIQYPILNHTCWQEPWFYLQEGLEENLLLDHSMFLCRSDYAGAAAEQLRKFKKSIPYAGLLLNTRVKWGFDFALDAVADDGTVYEVIHIEYDHNHYDLFKTRMLHFDYVVRHTDWYDAARRVWLRRDEWQGLKGFEQNHWKAKYLINWEKAEYTEKAI